MKSVDAGSERDLSTRAGTRKQIQRALGGTGRPERGHSLLQGSDGVHIDARTRNVCVWTRVPLVI